MEEIEKRVLALEGADWDALLIAEIKRWYDTVCSSALVQWTAALHSALLQNATKSVQVEHLINYRLRPIPTVQMEAFAGMYDDMDGDVLRALSEASIVPPPRPVFVAHVNRPNNPNARMDEAKARDGVLPLPSVPLSQAELDQLELLLARKRELSAPNKGPAGGRTFKAALVKVLEGLTEKIAKR